MKEQLLVKNSGYIILPKRKDDRDGSLIIAEANRTIPFEIKRVYYINNLENSVSVRGKHAHQTLKQVLFCISGSVSLLLDDGCVKQTILMNEDNVGVILGSGLWHEMFNFSDDCILLVFASDYYDEQDYIRDYTHFLNIYKGDSYEDKNE